MFLEVIPNQCDSLFDKAHVFKSMDNEGWCTGYTLFLASNPWHPFPGTQPGPLGPLCISYQAVGPILFSSYLLVGRNFTWWFILLFPGGTKFLDAAAFLSPTPVSPSVCYTFRFLHSFASSGVRR